MAKKIEELSKHRHYLEDLQIYSIIDSTVPLDALITNLIVQIATSETKKE